MWRRCPVSDRHIPDLPLRSLSQADGRRREVQVYRRLRRQLIADSGGAGNVTAARLAVIDTLAQAAAIQREEFARYVADPTHDPGRFIGLSNVVTGSARTLDLKRIPRDVNLREYLAQAPDKPAQPSTDATPDEDVGDGT